MIRYQCSTCDKSFGIKDDLAGRLALCPQCKTKFRVPSPELPADEDLEESYSQAPARKPQLQNRSNRRPIEDEEEEEEDQETARPRRRRIEEDDVTSDDEPVPRRPRKRRKKRRQVESSMIAGLDPFLVVLIGLGAIGLIIAVLGFFIPAMVLVAGGLGGLISLVGGFWFLAVAFQDDAVSGLLCLFVPFFSLYYLVTHFDETKKPFFLSLLGTFIYVVSFVAGIAALKKDIDKINSRSHYEWIRPIDSPMKG